jgi:hypothetical protein
MPSSSKQKGVRAEKELVEILNEAGIPSMRVLASGAMLGADSDIKLGVKLDSEGNLPPSDEAQAIMRVEVKNRKDNPDWIYEELRKTNAIALLQSERAGTEQLFGYLEQDLISTAAILKRKKIRPGALKDKDYNQTHIVCMGLSDFLKIAKMLYDNNLKVK